MHVKDVPVLLGMISLLLWSLALHYSGDNSEAMVPEGENRGIDGERRVCVRTEPRFRRVLMLCFPLSPSSSSLTGLNINGGGSTGFSMGGSSPYFLKWMRQSVHSKMFSRPPWCQSLEAEESHLQLWNNTFKGGEKYKQHKELISHYLTHCSHVAVVVHLIR